MSERLPDHVMLDDFERHMDLAECGDEDAATAMIMVMEFAKFMDENGRRLLLLARTCADALERKTGQPS